MIARVVAVLDGLASEAVGERVPVESGVER